MLSQYMCYYSTVDQANFLAECAGIELIGIPYFWNKAEYPEWLTEERRASYRIHDTGYSKKGYYFWQDRKYGGGACRITWFRGVVWVSSHSGYAHADITRDVCELAEDMGLKPVEDSSIAWESPMIYGVDRFLEYNPSFLREGD